MRKPLDILCILLPLYAFMLWVLSLGGVHVQNMNDLGLVSALPPLTLMALLIMIISFCLALRRMQTPVLLLHLLLLIIMLYGITTLVEAEPRFHIVYRHAGYTEYIMRTGTVDPYLDAYFDWPGFFIWTALLTQIAGYHDILAYAVWAPVFLNLAYLGPMYVIFTSATHDKRVVWLALWFFYITNWIGQDYYSPQGLDFFMYLVLIAILLKWFKVAPARELPSERPPIVRRRGKMQWQLFSPIRKFYAWLDSTSDIPSAPISLVQRVVLLTCLLTIFAFVVFSHPLTPFFTVTAVTALVVFRRCAPSWLPLVMGLMTTAWIIFMTQPFLQGHLDWVTGDAGQLKSIFAGNVTEHVAGDAQHVLITQLCIVMTLFVWGLAFLGAIGRWQQGHRDITLALLALTPFPLLAVQPYGGEMILRIYLFTLPSMAFFAASLFYTVINEKMSIILLHARKHEALSASAQLDEREPVARQHFWRQKEIMTKPAFLQTHEYKTPPWLTILIATTCMLLLCGFLFTRYGNEHMDNMTPGEVAGVHHLYSIAAPGSLFLEGSDGTPWQSQDFEKYDTYSLTDVISIDDIATSNVETIVQFIEDKVQHESYAHAYLIFTRSQKITATADYNLPPGTLDHLEGALLASGRFRLMYETPDAQILLFVEKGKGGPQ